MGFEEPFSLSLMAEASHVFFFYLPSVNKYSAMQMIVACYIGLSTRRRQILFSLSLSRDDKQEELS